MLGAWMAYTLVVSGLLGLAALACEKALVLSGRPVREVWIGALLGSVALPAVAIAAPAFLGRGAELATAVVAGVGSGPLQIAAASYASAEQAGGFSSTLGILWLAVLIAVVVYLAVATWRLRTERKAWRPGRFSGAPVMISNRRGPAVVGVMRPVIVIPSWLLELERRLQRAVFRHEREHLRAGDQRVYTLGVGLLLLTPWNPISWWQLARLRLAIEFDCDRRVLASGISRRSYVDALMAVGTRASRNWLPHPAFTMRRAPVEKRLRRIIGPGARLRTPRLIASWGVAALAVVLVLGAPVPGRLIGPDAGATNAGPDAPPGFAGASAGSELVPVRFRDPRPGPRVGLLLHVDATGAVDRFVTTTSSGNPVLDETARAVVPTLSFRPPAGAEGGTGVWMTQWFTFTPRRQRP